MVYGWRAAFIILRGYYSRRHLRTIRAVVTRWAPPRENNTENYVRHVSQYTGIHPDALLPPPDADPVTWRMIAAAMAQHENGPHTIDATPCCEDGKPLSEATKKPRRQTTRADGGVFRVFLRLTRLDVVVSRG